MASQHHKIRPFIFQGLPYVVALNPQLQEVYELYLRAFHRLITFRPITNLQDEREYTKLLANLLDDHKDVVTSLASSFHKVKVRHLFLWHLLSMTLSDLLIFYQHPGVYNLKYLRILTALQAAAFTSTSFILTGQRLRSIRRSGRTGRSHIDIPTTHPAAGSPPHRVTRRETGRLHRYYLYEHVPQICGWEMCLLESQVCNFVLLNFIH